MWSKTLVSLNQDARTPLRTFFFRQCYFNHFARFCGSRTVVKFEKKNSLYCVALWSVLLSSISSYESTIHCVDVTNNHAICVGVLKLFFISGISHPNDFGNIHANELSKAGQLATEFVRFCWEFSNMYHGVSQLNDCIDSRLWSPDVPNKKDETSDLFFENLISNYSSL